MDRLPPVMATSIDTVIGRFVPTRRFARVSFDSYQPDPRYPSQRAAVERLRAFAAETGPARRAHVLGRLMRKAADGPRGLYLDGGYGVGKTHLLAAIYHAVGDQRLYLSFAELAYTISRLGLEPTLAAMTNTRLLCIDEFELDDVAQTRMAATILRRLLDRRGQPIWIVTTSNTLPSDLGQGRFAADAFQREIGEIAATFEVVTIDGEDYRHRQWGQLAPTAASASGSAALRAAYAADPAADSARVLIDWSAMTQALAAVHPVHYAQIATQLDALFIDNLSRIDDQAVALRLVHLVDKLYDQEVRLMLTTRSGLPLSEIFAPAYRHGGYEKKYRRALSRLHELVSETDLATRLRRRDNGQDRVPGPRPVARREDPAPAD